MAAVKERSVEDTLKALFGLQTIHTQIKKIEVLRGELPMEVSDLEDEIAGLHTRLSKLDGDIERFEETIASNKNKAKDCEELIKKYDKQLSNVKNNREYDALTKEIELQKLEIQLFEKRNKEAHAGIENKKLYKEESVKEIELKDKELELKKKELEKIVKETEKEEKALAKQIDKYVDAIPERLHKAYERIRLSYRNGLSVVKFERNSCGGCFAKIPPQKMMEIKMRKKTMLCEHCGRIIVDPEIDMDGTED